jgi:hypothetical protein
MEEEEEEEDDDDDEKVPTTFETTLGRSKGRDMLFNCVVDCLRCLHTFCPKK